MEPVKLLYNDHLGLIVSGLREEEKNVDLKIKKARGSLFKLLGPAFSAKCLLSPALQLHLFQTFICPIARSGLSAMSLRSNHLQPLTAFHRKILRGFLHTSDRSPIPALFFLTGELPIEAKLHRDVFSLFLIIWNNPQTKIYRIVSYLLENSPENSHTWSRHIRNLAQMYDIQDPLTVIHQKPPPKEEYNEYIRTKITVYYEKQFRTSSSTNSKMLYLNVNVKGLNGRCHPALQNISSTNDVKRLRPHIKMLCSDLYTYEIKAAYQGGSPHCRLCQGDSDENRTQPQLVENISHILTKCSAYAEARTRIFHQMEIICSQSKCEINFKNILKDPEHLTQFILDCTSLNLPVRISDYDEVCPQIFALSRDLCFSINKTRLEILKKMKS